MALYLRLVARFEPTLLVVGRATEYATALSGRCTTRSNVVFIGWSLHKGGPIA